MQPPHTPCMHGMRLSLSQDFAGFRVLCILPRYVPQWPPEGYSGCNQGERNPMLGAPLAPLPILQVSAAWGQRATIGGDADTLFGLGGGGAETCGWATGTPGYYWGQSHIACCYALYLSRRCTASRCAPPLSDPGRDIWRSHLSRRKREREGGATAGRLGMGRNSDHRHLSRDDLEDGLCVRHNLTDRIMG